jgi:diketogulonate reductase-like aldo/keto reductase
MMPLLGLGTSRLASAYEAVRSALELGYRHIDTAAMYGNEAEVGRAVRDSGVARAEIFVTTKLANGDHDDVEGAIAASLERLGLEYIDLYLIHWPMPQRVVSWQTLEKLVAGGVPIRSIGVSNFTRRHLDELLLQANITPAANQVEFNPFVYSPELLKYNQAKSIQLVAYSPMTRAHKLDNPAIVQIAKDSGRTPPQVLLRWNIQHGVAVIPKADSPEHQRSNLDIFDWKLTDEQMSRLDALYDGFRVTEDPEIYP